jgi:hypothetical protein
MKIEARIEAVRYGTASNGLEIYRRKRADVLTAVMCRRIPAMLMQT